MFNLERAERLIIIFLVSALVVGLGMTALNESLRNPGIEIKKFNIPDGKGIAKDSPVVTEAKVNINEAGVEDLMKLKGVGKVLAERIMSYRSSNGPFLSGEEIKKVKGIGPALFDKIKDSISIE